MKTLLSLVIILTLPCFCLNAEICPEPISHSETDSTGTGGSLPGMGWGDTSDDATKVKEIEVPVDTSAIYNLSGQKSKEEGLVIKNYKCYILKK